MKFGKWKPMAAKDGRFVGGRCVECSGDIDDHRRRTTYEGRGETLSFGAEVKHPASQHSRLQLIGGYYRIADDKPEVVMTKMAREVASGIAAASRALGPSFDEAPSTYVVPPGSGPEPREDWTVGWKLHWVLPNELPTYPFPSGVTGRVG